MTHEIFIVQIYTKNRWINANYYDTKEGAIERAKFYFERGNLNARIKEKNTKNIIFQI